MKNVNKLLLNGSDALSKHQNIWNFQTPSCSNQIVVHRAQIFAPLCCWEDYYQCQTILLFLGPPFISWTPFFSVDPPPLFSKAGSAPVYMLGRVVFLFCLASAGGCFPRQFRQKNTRYIFEFSPWFQQTLLHLSSLMKSKVIHITFETIFHELAV